MKNKHNFDEIVDCRNTDSWKWDYEARNGLIAMGCADTDFKCPQPIIDALTDRGKFGIYAYGYLSNSFFESIVEWYQIRHGCEINKAWVSFTPGVMLALNIIIHTFTNPGDQIVIQPPVYISFAENIKNVGRYALNNDLVLQDGKYYMDFNDLEKKVKDPKTKLFVLCNPHNPVCRVWNQDELKKICEICINNNVLVVSDEIYSDIIYEGYKHIPFISLSPEAAKNSIIISSPGKTFNINGLYSAYAIIPNEKYHEQYDVTYNYFYLDHNIFGVIASETAYTRCSDYVDQLMMYLAGNVQYVNKFLKKRMPEVNIIEPEGTFMMWIDFRKWGMSDEELKQFFYNAGVFLNSGVEYGGDSSGFMRINIACPRAILEKALNCISQAYENK